MKRVFYTLVAILLCCNMVKAQPLATKGFIPIKDSKLYYESTGQGEAIILLHAGFFGSYHVEAAGSRSSE